MLYNHSCFNYKLGLAFKHAQVIYNVLCCSRKYPYPHRRDWNPLGEGWGFCKTKKSMRLTLKYPGVRGLRQNSFHGGVKDIIDKRELTK